MLYESTIKEILFSGATGQKLLGAYQNSQEDLAAQEASRNLADNAYYKARVIAWTIWFEGYERGDIDFRELLQRAKFSLVALDIDDFHRWKTLGLLADKALAMTPPKRKKGNAGRVDPRKAIAVQLVDLASADGFVLSRESKNGRSAFEHVAEIMTRLGMETTSRQVHDWCYPSLKKKIPQ